MWTIEAHVWIPARRSGTYPGRENAHKETGGPAPHPPVGRGNRSCSGRTRGQPGAVEHLDAASLEAGVGEVQGAPTDDGRLDLVVRRPAEAVREVLTEAVLDDEVGLVGDTWRARGSRHTADGSASPDMQITLMSSRAAALIAGPRERWPLAGDQLYVDLDLSVTNLPPGTRLSIGSAVVEVTAAPHTGCQEFAQRFGIDAARFVNSDVGRELNLRGINARVVAEGTVRPGDRVRKTPS